MALTDYQAKYLAWELTKRCPSDSIEKLAGALVDAQVDLNPHQVEAALFAFRSPLSKGALLADEVGLGKTIEAGMVLSQKWAERKRRILIITPSNLRKQWHQELQEKFFLSCQILESKSYREIIKAGNIRPFIANGHIVICSYQFASSHAGDIRDIHWDLVVIDEAHRLRNVYKPSNVIANTLKLALGNSPKLLLTATPLQNSLLELYGLVSFIDDQVFGDVKVFREQFSILNDNLVFRTLKKRLQPICHRTLRRQVVAYVPFTRRHPMLQPFTPEEGEDRLYNLVSAYLQRDNLMALPHSQRTLMTLVLRKLLASSSFAIAGSLATLSLRLQLRLQGQPKPEPLSEELDEDYEALDETEEDWGETEEPPPPLSDSDRKAIEQEIRDLNQFRELAESITFNAKGRALLIALEKAFAEADRLGAARKAIIFTESRRTQLYLERVLADSPWKDGVVLFNGANTDEKSRRIYAEWKARHEGTDRLTGSRTADMRSALVDYFKDQGQIMIATEAGAEGINLQFCSLVVNYDLPWNPQRVEQRIGRCHRYGQKHDVVVVNFLNQKNEADRRVFQLLAEKFRLFEGVFGASDEVLGAIESGVDFEKRIVAIYQNCRTPEQIRDSFDSLQAELGSEIDEAMTRTRKQLLENFDEEVQEKLKFNLDQGNAYLTRYEQMLMKLTRHELGPHAEFMDEQSAFRLISLPFPGEAIPLGLYELPRRSGEAYLYRLGHPLAQRILALAKARQLDPVELTFDHAAHHAHVAALDPWLGQQGELLLSALTVDALDQVEDYLLICARTDDGQILEEEAARRLLSLPVVTSVPLENHSVHPHLEEWQQRRRAEITLNVSERNARFFEGEAAKLDSWAEDIKLGLEQDIKDLDRQIREAKRLARLAPSLEEKLQGQRKIKSLEAQRNQKRLLLYEAQDKVDQQRDELIAKIEGQLKQKVVENTLFSIRWRLT
ncbi:MAG TPA: SNF2-related protein [Candidatus Aminicenantes bacterium]|nr:SNF2-related protein [Candidatus Aminicenantes bacterium]